MVGMLVSFWDVAYFQVLLLLVSGRVVYLVVENSTHLKNYASQKNYIISPGKCSCPVIFWMSFIPWDPIICKANHQPGNSAKQT